MKFGTTMPLAVLVALLGGCCCTKPAGMRPPVVDPAAVRATTPVPASWSWYPGWAVHFDAQDLAVIDHGEGGLVFLGDSITEFLEGRGASALKEHFGKYNPVVYGLSGDHTENLLWRLRYGHLGEHQPRVAVLMIGTNNFGHDPTATPEQVLAGISAILEDLRVRCPRTKVLVLGIYPRGEKPDDPFRAKIGAVNAQLPALARAKGAEYADPGVVLLSADGTLSKDITPDFLHPSTAGYEKLATALAPVIGKMMEK